MLILLSIIQCNQVMENHLDCFASQPDLIVEHQELPGWSALSRTSQQGILTLGHFLPNMVNKIGIYVI